MLAHAHFRLPVRRSRKLTYVLTSRYDCGTMPTIDEQLDRLRDRGGRFSAAVRLVHCITGPRLRRQYFLGTDVNVSVVK